jgi:hypothetical protein
MCLQLSSHPFTFLWLLGIVQKFVRRYNPSKMDKKIQKELQDIIQQLLQTCAMFAGQSIRFNSSKGQIIPLPAIVNYIAPLKDYDEEDDIDMPPLAPWLSDPKLGENYSRQLSFMSSEFSINLMTLRSLANVLAIIIDDVWDDKEKANIILSQILPHIFPLLDVHSVENIENSVAASVLMSSLCVGKVCLQIVFFSKII